MRQQAYEFHHNGGADGEAFVHLFAVNHALYGLRDESFVAVTAVVGHNDYFIARTAHLFLQDNQFFSSCSQNRHNAVSRRFQCLHDGQHRGNAHAAAGADHRSEIFDVRGTSERSHNVRNVIAGFEGAEFLRGKSHVLHHERDGAALLVGLGNGKRYAFAGFAYAHNDKMPGASRTGNKGCFNFKAEHFF